QFQSLGNVVANFHDAGAVALILEHLQGATRNKLAALLNIITGCNIQWKSGFPFGVGLLLAPLENGCISSVESSNCVATDTLVRMLGLGGQNTDNFAQVRDEPTLAVGQDFAEGLCRNFLLQGKSIDAVEFLPEVVLILKVLIVDGNVKLARRT